MIIRSLWLSVPWLLLGPLAACHPAMQAPLLKSAAASGPAAAPLRVTATLAPASATLTAPEATETSPFVEGIRLGYVARLLPLGKSAVLSTERLLLGINGDRVAFEPAFQEGLHSERARFPSVVGSLPDSAWALEVSDQSRTSRTMLSRWTGSEWLSADAALQGKSVIAISAWSGGRTLALLGDEYQNQLGFAQLAGARNTPLPELPRAQYDATGCVHGIEPSALSALPNGEVFLAGTLCEADRDGQQKEHGVAIEHWASGHARGQITTLPALSEREVESARITSFAATSGNDVLVAGQRVPIVPEGTQPKSEAYLAHFDGKAWRVLSAPPIEGIDELQRSADGALWLLYQGDLWTTTSQASETAVWQQARAPHYASDAGEHAFTSLWVRDNGQVWATVSSDDSSYLLRTQRGAEPLSAPPAEQVAALTRAVDPNALAECETPTLVLLKLAQKAPKDSSFPGVRGALRGHSEFEGKAKFIEFTFLTRRYLGVRGDRDTLQQVSELLAQASLPGVEPELRCLQVSPTRTLTVDLGGTKTKQTARPRRSNLQASRETLVGDFGF